MDIGLVFDEMFSDYSEKMERMVPHYRALIERMVSHLPHSSQVRNVLELGAGNGNVSALAVAKYRNAYFQLVDASEKMIESLQTTFADQVNIVYDLCLIQDCDFPENSFDLIIACFSLHHLPGSDKESTFKSIYKWLRPSGQFTYADLFIDKESEEHRIFLEGWKAFVVKEDHNDWEWLMDHYAKFDFPNAEKDQIEWLRKAGFQNLSIKKFDQYWVHLIAQK